MKVAPAFWILLLVALSATASVASPSGAPDQSSALKPDPKLARVSIDAINHSKPTQNTLDSAQTSNQDSNSLFSLLPLPLENKEQEQREQEAVLHLSSSSSSSSSSTSKPERLSSNGPRPFSAASMLGRSNRPPVQSAMPEWRDAIAKWTKSLLKGPLSRSAEPAEDADCEADPADCRSEFENILFIGVFFGLIWLVGRALKIVHGSPLVGEILVGIIFGPSLLNLVPFPDALSTLGTLGVMLLVMESGLEIDFSLLKLVGPKAFVVAVTGVIIPVIAASGTALLYGAEEKIWPGAIVIGAALAPTSVGIIARFIHEQHAGHSRFGQLITIAAVMDDILALLIVTEITAIPERPDDVNFTYYVSPLLYFTALLAVTFFLSWILPKVLPSFLALFPYDEEHRHLREDVLLMTLVATTVVFCILADILTRTFLIGCFLAGFAFAHIPQTHPVWKKQMKRTVYWLARLFFAATIGFQADPIRMIQPNVLLFGLILTPVAIGSKLISGYLAGKGCRWTVGWAMVARAEFGFLVAEEARAANLLSADNFAALYWPLCICSMISPLITNALVRREAKKGRKLGADPNWSNPKHRRAMLTSHNSTRELLRGMSSKHLLSGIARRPALMNMLLAHNSVQDAQRAHEENQRKQLDHFRKLHAQVVERRKSKGGDDPVKKAPASQADAIAQLQADLDAQETAKKNGLPAKTDAELLAALEDPTCPPLHAKHRMTVAFEHIPEGLEGGHDYKYEVEWHVPHVDGHDPRWPVVWEDSPLPFEVDPIPLVLPTLEEFEHKFEHMSGALQAMEHHHRAGGRRSMPV